MTGDSIKTALRKNDFELVKKLHESGQELPDNACYLAIVTENTVNTLEILKFARKSGCSWNAEITAAAAGIPVKERALKVVKYLHESGCEWDSETCAEAAAAGNLELLKYAREHGCDWYSNTCRDAAAAEYNNNESDALACLKFAHESGCEWNEDTVEAAVSSEFDSKNWSCLLYCYEHSCPGVKNYEEFIQNKFKI